MPEQVWRMLKEFVFVDEGMVRTSLVNYCMILTFQMYLSMMRRDLEIVAQHQLIIWCASNGKSGCSQGYSAHRANKDSLDTLDILHTFHFTSLPSSGDFPLLPLRSYISIARRRFI